MAGLTDARSVSTQTSHKTQCERPGCCSLSDRPLTVGIQRERGGGENKCPWCQRVNSGFGPNFWSPTCHGPAAATSDPLWRGGYRPVFSRCLHGQHRNRPPIDHAGRPARWLSGAWGRQVHKVRPAVLHTLGGVVVGMGGGLQYCIHWEGGWWVWVGAFSTVYTERGGMVRMPPGNLWVPSTDEGGG